MAAISSRSGSRRRSMNEINMVPFIDLMLVLLIIFMVTASVLTPGKIDVPKVGKSDAPPKTFAQVIVQKDGTVQWKVKGGSEQTVTLQSLGTTAKEWQATQTAEEGDKVPVIISAEKTVTYETVVKAMDALQRAGVQHVGLSVNKSGG